jgi:hypothetical protein
VADKSPPEREKVAMKLNRKKVAKRAMTGFAASILIGAMSSLALAQDRPVSNFNNGYLNEHPEVAQQLAGNPGLVDNQQFMASHPGLRDYLANHPEVRQDIKQHPYQFMSREDQLNNWHGKYFPQNWYNNGGNPGPAARFDNGYLRSHPEVAQQLAANPALIDNPQYMNSHPELQHYLAEHPQVRQDIKEHPRQFMSREDQLNGWHHGPYYGAHPYANTDNFLDQNPQLAQQLEQNPRLVDNPQFLASHPQLREYLQTHPYARQDWRSHPYRFVQHEKQYMKNH